MKKSIRNSIVGILSASFLMAAPLATTVYANEYKAAPSYNNNGKMDSQRDSGQLQYQHGQSPVEVVRANASKLGFDAVSDIFKVEKETATSAVVKVFHDGSNFKVTLKRTQNNDYNQKQDSNQVQNRDQRQNHNQIQDQKQGQKQDRNQNQDSGLKQDRIQDQHQNDNKQNNKQQYGEWIIQSVEQI
ncbi:hypothetical protein SPSIL_013110 [Sporomusa silvacetica DSM 10669]|uniref:Peptidase propeptide and YPEB domain protein n=1 Tax=Sporomusa silvacetica DSM 10669 TaxID=1123289 RepID=A0ABZ3II70_9FIRM|nr:hypothetical protein [Sporomusa silvacetica]OZC17395.1 hypothetical protein SPSIL_32060 [Sporomusa silvacetica DSM 10669]